MADLTDLDVLTELEEAVAVLHSDILPRLRQALTEEGRTGPAKYASLQQTQQTVAVQQGWLLSLVTRLEARQGRRKQEG